MSLVNGNLATASSYRHQGRAEGEGQRGPARRL